MATGAVIARIISEYSDKGTKAATRDINKVGKQFDDFGKKVARSFAVAAAASAALAVKIGTDAVKAAIEDQKSAVILANSLRNTVGATEEAIAATEKYISKQQLLVGVSDTQLRQSLITLTNSTHSLTEAQALQNIALDVAASGYGDLESVSKALAKAYAGNFTALKKLVPGLDANIIKSKDLNAAMKYLSATFGGAAAASADTLEGRLRILKLSYDEILESLGYALLPVVQKFAEYLTSDVLPKIQEWVDANKDQLAASLQTVSDVLKQVLKRLGQFSLWVTNNMGTIKVIGGIIAALFAVGRIAAFVKALMTINAAFVILRATALGTAIATAFATGGISIAGAAAALAAAGLATVGLAYVKKQMDGGNEKVAKSSQVATAQMEKNSYATEKAIKFTNTYTNATGKLTAEQVKAAKVAKQLAAVNKELANKGLIAKTETDPIQLEAVRLNLLKQHNVELDAAYARLVANYEAQMTGNVAAQRYADILGVIADKDISNAEIGLLAAKWGESQAAVIAYIASILGADSYSKDLINPGAIAAMGWQKALGDLNNYVAALKVIPPYNPIAGAPAGQTGAPSSFGYGSTQGVSDTLRAADQAIADALAAAAIADAASAAAQSALDAVQPTIDALAGIPRNPYGANNMPLYQPGGTGLTAPSSSTALFGTYSASTASNGATGGGGVTIINNVQGSVVTSNDLSSIVKDNLLQGQMSGKAINLSATMF